MKTSEVLHRAALIEKRGWRTGDWQGIESPDQPLCIEGALLAALGLGVADIHTSLLACPAYRAVSEYLGDERLVNLIYPDDPSRRLWQFNDTQAEGEREVIEVLRAAAVIEAAKEAAAEREAVSA